MTEQQLIKLAKNWNAKATAQLISTYIPLIRSIAEKFNAPALEVDDLVQEGLIGFINAIYNFKPELNVPFKNFSMLCAQNKMNTAVKAATRLKNQPLNNFVPIDEQNFAQSDLWTTNPENIVLNNEKSSSLSKLLKDVLSKFEREVLVFYLDGLSYLEISEKTGSSEKSISNALVRVRKKLKELFVI